MGPLVPYVSYCICCVPEQCGIEGEEVFLYNRGTVEAPDSDGRTFGGRKLGNTGAIDTYGHGKERIGIKGEDTNLRSVRW